MAGKAALIRFAWVILTISSLTTARPSWGQVTGSAPPPVSSAQTLEVVVNGQPRAAVVIPRQADSWTRRAAGWVVEYVRKATGAELPLVEEPARGVGGPRIAVGHTVMAMQAGLTVDNLKWDGCRLAVQQRLLSNESPPGINGIRSFFNSRGVRQKQFLRAPETWDLPAMERKFGAQTRGSGIPPARQRNAIAVVPEVSVTETMEGS